MGKAGKALRQALANHDIRQNRLAVTMRVGRSTIHQWHKEASDPSAEAVTRIVDALEKINPEAAKDFISLYLGRKF